jgi:hypothetical protein
MKKLKLFALFTIIFSIILTVQLTTLKMEAQELSPSISCSGGETFYTQNYSLDFSIGEPISESYEGNLTMLTQGFLQDIVGPTAISENNERLTGVNIYPNPASQFISLNVEDAIIKWYEIVNIYGISLEKTSCKSNPDNIDVSSLRPGVYLLKLGIEDHNPFAKKFIKK